jgi:dipeptidyl aminopeptidase/acylaminoacyl peptidase
MRRRTRLHPCLTLHALAGNSQAGGRVGPILVTLKADATAALRCLRLQPGVNANNIFVLGHSEGALLAIELAGTAGVAVHGILLLDAPALPMDQIITKQAKNAPPSMIAMIRGSAWYASYLGHDPAKEVRRVHVPILVLQGGRDGNVLATDTPRLVAAARATNKDVSVVYFSADNHEFLSRGQLTPQYVDPAMIAALLRWLSKHSRT